MIKVDFFTPVSFGDQPKSSTQSLLETLDGYFYLGGRKAYVIPSEAQQDAQGTVLTEGSPSFLATALKVISYLTIVIPVILLIAKAVLRSGHRFHVIDPKQKLEQGVDISDLLKTKIRSLMPKITRGEDNAEIIWHAKGNNLVFSLVENPHLVFKMTPPNRSVAGAEGARFLSPQQATERRFANMVKAKEVCLAHQLNLLIIPQAKKFNVDGTILIAEQRVDISQDESANEHLYTLPGLNKTAKQLATFIAKTGFSDVEWRNIPVMDREPAFVGDRRVALVDLEEMNGAKRGIFGEGDLRRGLIRCLHSKELIDIVLAEAERLGIRSQESIQDLITARLEEIQGDGALQQFYRTKGILNNPRKPIQVNDLASLGLDLEEEVQHPNPLITTYDASGKLVVIDRHGNIVSNVDDFKAPMLTLREAIGDVIAEINDALTKTPEEGSIKGKRSIVLDHNHNNKLGLYHKLGVPGGLCRTTDEENRLWLRKIINALVKAGHLFKFEKQNGHGYFIQA